MPITSTCPSGAPTLCARYWLMITVLAATVSTRSATVKPDRSRTTQPRKDARSTVVWKRMWKLRLNKLPHQLGKTGFGRFFRLGGLRQLQRGGKRRYFANYQDRRTFQLKVRSRLLHGG